MNNASVNLHRHCSNIIFLYNFAWFDVSEFWAWLAKI